MNNQTFLDNSKLNLISLPSFLLKYIVTFIDCSNDRHNLRLTNKLFYYLIKNVSIFDDHGRIMKKVYFKNHSPFKCIYFDYLNSEKYIKKICPIKNFKVNGNMLIYNKYNELCCKSMFLDNTLHGRTFFWENKRLVICSDYKNGKKHGKEFILVPLKNKTYLSEYENNKLISKKIKEFNQIISKSYFYYNTCKILVKSKFLGPNEISITNKRFHKTSLIHQHDRKLHLQFILGYLGGTQAVTSRDNDLKYIGTYSFSRPHGKYKCFNNKKMIEEGEIEITGNMKYINQYDSFKTKKYKFDKFQRLNGCYSETDITKKYIISFKNGSFDGSYYESFYLEDYWFQFNYYNENNYKIELKTRSILVEIEKILGRFMISIKYVNGNYINIDSLYLGRI